MGKGKDDSKLKYLRMGIFAIILIGLVIYLGFGRKAEGESAKAPTNIAVSSESSSEASSSSASSAAASSSFLGGDNTKENRPKILLNEADRIDNHQLIASNDKFDVYLKEENLSLIIRNKRNGALMYSTVENPDKSNETWQNFAKSGVVVEFLKDTNLTTQQADMYSQNPKKVVTKVNNGFNAEVSYPSIGIKYKLEVRLDEQGIEASIPDSSIKETDEHYKIGNIYIYPFMGYSKMDEEKGYMFIPDGAGALISLEDHKGQYKQPYSEMVFGQNGGLDESSAISMLNDFKATNEAQKILAPVFGVAHEDAQFGYLGVVEDGSLSAKIEAYPNGAILPYNWITPKFIYRQIFNQSISKGTGTIVVRQKNRNTVNAKIKYLLLDDKADYSAMATKYQRYLLRNGQISKSKNEFKIRVDMLGADIKKNLLGTEIVSMTTYEQAANIYKQLKAAGIQDVSTVYKGWQKNGISAGLAAQKFATEKKLGTTSVLVDLTKQYAKDGNSLYLYDNTNLINPSSTNGSNVKQAIKYNKRPLEYDIHGYMYRTYDYLTPADSSNLLLRRVASYQDESIDNLYLNGITNELYSILLNGKEKNRVYAANIYKELLNKVSKKMNLALEEPFSIYWRDANALMDMPTESSDYTFVSEEVPFISMVLKGIKPIYANYTNFQSNNTEFFLDLVEQGLNPSFIVTQKNAEELEDTNSADLYSSEFKQYLPEIKKYYSQLKSINAATNNSTIVQHDQVDGVATVTYSNGVKVIVNHNKKAAKVDDITVSAESYKVVKK